MPRICRQLDMIEHKHIWRQQITSVAMYDAVQAMPHSFCWIHPVPSLISIVLSHKTQADMVQTQMKAEQLQAVMRTHLAELILSLAPHVINNSLCPGYERLYVLTVIPKDPPAVLTIATEAALQPLHKPAKSAIPVMFGRKRLSHPTSRASL